MTDSSNRRSWSTENGAVMHAIQRPDGAWLLRLPDQHFESWDALLGIASAEVTDDMLVTRPVDQSPEEELLLRKSGFTPSRQETIWRIPVANILAKPQVSTGHQLVSVISLDADTVAELDNKIRRDIPGTEGWVGTGAELTATLNDPEFDPALYRIARHSDTGSLDGLIRVWNRTPEPRIGCLGVTRPWRKTRLALLLLQDVARTLDERGITHVVTETDTTNRDSSLMARNQGGEAVRATNEWQRLASG